MEKEQNQSTVKNKSEEKEKEEIISEEAAKNSEKENNNKKEIIEENPEEKILKLEPNKVLKVTFNDRVFVSKNGKFYESIEENSNFSLLADTFLEAYIPEYQPGIQEKPDPRYRKNNSVFLYYKKRFTYIERRKNFLISMFDKSKSKEINTFYKKNKISPRDDNELKSLFINFFDFLSL